MPKKPHFWFYLFCMVALVDTLWVKLAKYRDFCRHLSAMRDSLRR
jgi:hypothetical protein